jgi:hypothetical protein
LARYQRLGLARGLQSFAGQRLVPAWAEFGVSRDDVTFSILDAHSFMAGDLSGAAQPG